MGFHLALEGGRLCLFPALQPDMGGTPIRNSSSSLGRAGRGVIWKLLQVPLGRAHTALLPLPRLSLRPLGVSLGGKHQICSLICSQDGDH